MRRRLVFAVIPLLLLLLVGCAREQQEISSGLMLYCLSDLEEYAGSDAIREVPVASEAAEGLTPGEKAVWLLQQLAVGGEGYASPLPADVAVASVTLQGRRAYVDMSRNYSNLTGVELSLADYCITLTLCQLEEITSVSITAGGHPVILRNSQVMREEDVLFSGMEDVVSTLEVKLWFPDEEGELSEETRELSLYEGKTLVEAVADALVEGPQDRGRQAVLPAGFVFRSVWLEDSACCINLPRNSLALLPETAAEQQRLLEAVSRTFLAIDTVEELRFLVDGSEVNVIGVIPVADYCFPTEEEEIQVEHSNAAQMN